MKDVVKLYTPSFDDWEDVLRNFHQPFGAYVETNIPLPYFYTICTGPDCFNKVYHFICKTKNGTYLYKKIV